MATRAPRSSSILPEALRAFRLDHPQVGIELLSMLSEHEDANLETGRIQVGVSRYLGPPPAVDGLVFTPKLDDPFVVALPVSNRLTKRKSLRAQEVDGMGLIMRDKAAVFAVTRSEGPSLITLRLVDALTATRA